MQKGQSFVNPRTGEQLEILQLPRIAAEGELAQLKVLRLLRPGQGFPFPHAHLDLTEIYRVRQGIADGLIERRRVRMARGEEWVITPGIAHVNPCNRSRTDLLIEQTFDPGTEAAYAYVEALGDLMSHGRTIRGDLPPVTAMAVFEATDGETYAGGLPVALQRRVVYPLAGSWARWRRTYPPAVKAGR